MTQYKSAILILLIGVGLSVLLLMAMPKIGTITYTTPRRTGYIRLDFLSIGIVVVASLALSTFVALKK